MFSQIINIKDLSINYIRAMVKEHSCFYIHNPGGELFQHPESETAPENCLCVDMQSANLICTLYDNLNEKNQSSFNSLLQDEFKLARFLDKMWSFVK